MSAHVMMNIQCDFAFSAVRCAERTQVEAYQNSDKVLEPIRAPAGWYFGFFHWQDTSEDEAQHYCPTHAAEGKRRCS